MTYVPRRALIVSADIGEGHNAAGRALEEGARRVWPRCDVRWLDAVAAVAPWFPRLARGQPVGGGHHRRRPVGPIPPTGRLAAIRAQVGLGLRRGQPDGAALVLRALNLLPPPVQRRAAAAVCQRRWFNLLVSIFPGDRRHHHLLGLRVQEVYPVLPVADGVGLAIGAMTWERSLGMGVLADAELVADVDKLAAEITDAFRDYQAAARARNQPILAASRRNLAAGCGRSGAG